MKIFFRDILTTLVIAAVIYFGLRIAVDHSIVVSSSMTPSLQVGQHLIINKVVYRLHEPERGDIVVLHSPRNQKEDLIKRIIGMPGEIVEIEEGIVYIHTEDSGVLPLNEPYIKQPARDDFKGDKIPENEYFVMGDNRNNSSDARDGWTLPRQNIVGKAWLSVWPPDRWGLAANYPLQEKIDGLVSNK